MSAGGEFLILRILKNLPLMQTPATRCGVHRVKALKAGARLLLSRFLLVLRIPDVDQPKRDLKMEEADVEGLLVVAGPVGKAWLCLSESTWVPRAAERPG